MIVLTEATFAQRVLRAALPVLVCVRTRACPGRQALHLPLARVSAAYQGRLQVATMLLDAAPLLAEQYGIAASPTIMAFEHGDLLGQAIGFLPEGLLNLLAEDIVNGALAGGQRLSPVEERFEDVVLLPLLHRWGLTVERQILCSLPGRNRSQRGRIDLLVREHPDGPPLTLMTLRVGAKRHREQRADPRRRGAAAGRPAGGRLRR